MEHIRGHVSIKFYISGYLMARRLKQQQRPVLSRSNVEQAQAPVSNIYIYIYIYFIIPILPNITIDTIN